MLLFTQLHFIKLIVDISIFFGLQKKSEPNIG